MRFLSIFVVFLLAVSVTSAKKTVEPTTAATEAATENVKEHVKRALTAAPSTDKNEDPATTHKSKETGDSGSVTEATPKVQVIDEVPEELTEAKDEADEKERNEVTVLIHEAIDGSAPSIELKTEKEATRLELERTDARKHPHARLTKKFLKKLNADQKQQLAKIFADSNKSGNEKKEAIVELLKESEVKKSFRVMSKKMRNNRVQIERRLLAAMRSLPKAEQQLEAILDDSSQTSKQLGGKISTFIKTLPKDVAFALFNLRTIFEGHARRTHHEILADNRDTEFLYLVDPPRPKPEATQISHVPTVEPVASTKRAKAVKVKATSESAPETGTTEADDDKDE